MGYIKIKLYQEVEDRFNITIKDEFIKNEKEYFEDCEILLNAGNIKPTSLLEILNSIHHAIQFTMKVIENSLPFYQFN